MRRIVTHPLPDTKPVPPGESVQVCLEKGRPYGVIWNGLSYQVLSIHSTWRVDGGWWLDSQRIGIRRRYFRLALTRPQARGQEAFSVEIYNQNEIYSQNEGWKIWRILD